MKNKFLHGAAALAVCAGFVACSEYDAGIAPETWADAKALQYELSFVRQFGKIDPEQDWGFGSANVTETRAITRAVEDKKWTDHHDEDCNVDKIMYDFTLPTGAIDVTQPNFDKSGSVYYVPKTFKGELDLQWLGFNGGDSFYNYGEITLINNVNYNGQITIYNAGTIENFAPSSGGRHTIYNTKTGVLKVAGYANIGDLYNSGTLILEREHNPYWANEGGVLGTVDKDISIYSTGLIEMPDCATGEGNSTHFDAKFDVHNTVKVKGNVEFQNEDRPRYICGIEVEGNLYLNKGALYTSYIKANSMNLNAFPLYLLPEAHVDVEGTITVKESGSYIYGHTDSNALVEAGSFYFENKNDLTHTFSDNIYFKVHEGGSITINGCWKNAHSSEWQSTHPDYDGGETDQKVHKYNDIETYLANTEDEYHLVKGRLNAGNAVGNPACGNEWTIGTPEEPKERELVKRFRIYCEDLGDTGDFDFNDVVFDVLYYSDYTMGIKAIAAGGTLPLTVDGYKVKDLFGVKENVMVNTGLNQAEAEEVKIPAVNGQYKYANPINIPIVVTFTDKNENDEEEVSDEWAGNLEDVREVALSAEMGRAPQKLCVDLTGKTGTPWADEYTRIERAFPMFKEWVNNNKVSSYDVFNNPIPELTDQNLDNNKEEEEE